MRYLKGKIHFNKKELESLSEENPTLFELAQRYAHEAHISQVFYVSNATLAAVESGDPACSKMRCWNMRNDPDGKLPCWFRTWNEFVSDMRSSIEYDFDVQ